MNDFSIVVPSFNRAHTLPRLFESMVRQTYQNFEVLLIDDGSTDNTKEICDQYKDRFCLRYFPKSNGGKHTALNIGIEEARGEFFIILDSKSWLADNALERLLELWNGLQEKEKYASVLTRRKENEKIVGLMFPKDGYITSMTDFHFITGYKLKGSLGGFGDCLGCDRTDVMKQYRFPEPENTKFVPEYYIYDQIGEQYRAFGVNEVLEFTEYQEDGITKNAQKYYRDNYIGILHGLTNRLDRVISVNKKVPIKAKIEVWLTYWTYVAMDVENKGPRVCRMTALGRICKKYYKFRTGESF